MMKEQFYPNWFKKDKIFEQKKNLKKVLLLSIIFALLSFINIYNVSKEIIEYKKSNIRANSTAVEEENYFQAVKELDAVYHNFKDGKEKIKTLNISNGIITIKIFASDLKEYGQIVKSLEENFIIEEITPLNTKEEEIYFSLRMRYNEIF